MKRFQIAVSLFVAAAALCVLWPSRAQADFASHAVSVQVGVGSQLSSSASHAASSDSFHAGAALALSETTTLLALPGTSSIDIDYNHASGHGGKIDAYGATYTNRISLIPKVVQPLTLHTVPYVGFGIGAFRDEVRKRVTSGATTTDITGAKTTVGGKLLAGVDTASGFFVEGTYLLSGSANGVRTDSLNLAVGVHF